MNETIVAIKKNQNSKPIGIVISIICLSCKYSKIVVNELNKQNETD